MGIHGTMPESPILVNAEPPPLRCGLCGAAPLMPVMQAPRVDGGTATLARCSTCRLVQVSPLPDDTELARYYHTYAYGEARAWETPAAVVSSLSTLLASLEPFRTTGRMLDIGCGAGQMLRVARQRGWLAHGTELSDVACARLRQEGFPIAHLDSPDVPPGSFDVITMAEVLEHLRDPLTVVRRVQELLRPGGALYLTTPNFNALSRRCLGAKWRVIEVPEHLFYFTTGSLQALVRRAGLEPRWVRTEGINPLEIVRGLRQPCRTQTTAVADHSTPMLRDAAHRHPLLGLLKRGVNQVLRWTHSGDTLKALAVKRATS